MKSMDIKTAVAHIISQRKWYEALGYSQTKGWTISKKFNDGNLPEKSMKQIIEDSQLFDVVPAQYKLKR